MKSKCLQFIICLFFFFSLFIPAFAQDNIKFKFTNADKAKVQYNMAVNFVKRKEYASAIEHFKLSTQLDPSNYKAFYNLGIANSVLKNHQEAIEAFQSSIKLKQDDAYSYYNMAIEYSELKDLANAQKNYELAIQYKPDLSEAYANLAMIYLYNKQTDEYKQMLARLELLDPKVAEMVKQAAGK